MEERVRGPQCRIYKDGVKEKFLYAIEKGATYATACGFAGISYDAFYAWRKKAELILNMPIELLADHPDKIYVDFYWRVKEVESFAAMKWLDKIEQAANVQWQAAAWKLERRHPEQYGRTEKDKHEDTDNSLVEKARLDVTKLKEDEHGRSSATEG